MMSSNSRRNVSFSILFIATASSPTYASAASSSRASLALLKRSSSLPHQLRSARASLIVGKLRGGGDDDDSSSGTQKKKRKGKSKKKKSAVTTTEEGSDGTSFEEGADDDDDREDEGTDVNNAINDVMKETDAAAALGDAIRDRADLLREDRLPYSARTFDAALVSLGLSLGTAGTDKDGEDDGGGNLAEGEDEAGTVDTLAYYQYGHRNSIHPYYGNSGNGQMNRQHVQPSTSAVIANYFLKTHGGTHAIQCLLSLLASSLGVACLLLPAFPSTAALATAAATSAGSAKATSAKHFARKILLSSFKYQLMQQTLLLAMAKHASGILGAASLGASRIPQLGIRNARQHLESVASDPVGQYLFYCSLLVVWMGWFGGGGSGGGTGGMRDYVATLRGNVISIMNASAAAAASSDATASNSQDTANVNAMSQLLDTLSQQPPPWFLSQSTGGFIVPILILGPVLLREIVSYLWVCSDVLVLAATSSGGRTVAGKLCSGALSGCRSVLDAFMSILFTPVGWRKADSFRRQRTLARSVSRCSLVMELAVGAILMGDAVQSFWRFALVGGPAAAGVGDATAASGGRSSFKRVLGKMACAHLYFNFLLSRRNKIATVIDSVRGGGGGAVMNRILDVLIDPKKEMGLSEDATDDNEE